MNRWWTPCLLILPVLCGVLLAIYHRREAYSYKLRLAFKMFAAYIIAIVVAAKLGQKEFANCQTEQRIGCVVDLEKGLDMLYVVAKEFAL